MDDAMEGDNRMSLMVFKCKYNINFIWIKVWNEKYFFSKKMWVLEYSSKVN